MRFRFTKKFPCFLCIFARFSCHIPFANMRCNFRLPNAPFFWFFVSGFCPVFLLKLHKGTTHFFSLTVFEKIFCFLEFARFFAPFFVKNDKIGFSFPFISISLIYFQPLQKPVVFTNKEGAGGSHSPHGGRQKPSARRRGVAIKPCK